MKNKILFIMISIFIMSTNVYAKNTNDTKTKDIINTQTKDENGEKVEQKDEVPKDKNGEKLEQKDEVPKDENGEKLEQKDEVPKDKNGKNLTGEDLRIYNIVKNSLVYTPTTFEANTIKSETEDDITFIKSKKTTFKDKDTYYINRIFFKQNSDKMYTVNIPIYGKKIEVRYVDPIKNEWVNTSNLNNLKKTTLYINTDKKSYIVSVPAVYKNDFTNNTLTIAYDKEKMVTMEKMDGYFNLSMSFPQNKDYVCEYWYMESDNYLVDWNKKQSFVDLISHDLSETRRWSYDGYYFQTPTNYLPSGEGVLYKQPSNYTGARFAIRNSNELEKNLGYIMMETCMQNINELGYWETGPQSDWLFKDFGIGAGFYDTRFNTDFATSLLYAYQNYNNKEFLAYAIKYADYFINFANNNNYKTSNGGILVEDYGYKKPHEKTHVSLNHHLAELNFLYEIYNITKEKSYLELADKMLLGIEGTRNKWVLPDGNLAYAMHYNKGTNKMQDYPYLTYNDLYHTKGLLKKLFNKTNDTIEFLMASKKQYMDKNKITGYKK